MSIKVRIPTPLQKLTANSAEVMVEGKDIAEVLAALNTKHPGIREKLFDEQGKLRRFVNFFLNDEDIRFLQGANTPVKTGDQVSIVPAIAGGAPRLV